MLSASGEGRGCDLTPRLKPLLALITTTGPRYEVYRHAWEIKKNNNKRIVCVNTFLRGGVRGEGTSTGKCYSVLPGCQVSSIIQFFLLLLRSLQLKWSSVFASIKNSCTPSSLVLTLNCIYSTSNLSFLRCSEPHFC